MSEQKTNATPPPSSGTLLTTKLNAPSTGREILSRSRLLDQLREGTTRKLTLVSAPAGFGKTTILREWQAASDKTAAWLSLDDRDNDPALFFSYLIASIQTVDESFARSWGDALLMPHSPAGAPPVSALLNEMALSKHGFAVILDDFHVIEDSGVIDAFDYLLEQLPPHIHIIVATREDPPIRLSKLRAQNQLSELRAADLRFTKEEIQRFLNDVSGLALEAEQVDILDARTEGWIVGLQLAAMSLQDRDDKARFISEFAGDDRYILDYLTEEVLHRQPEDVRKFLLRTSHLERLTGPLCDAVTGRSDGQRMLERLAAANVFVFPLDNRRRWYRYHHLFADLLASRTLFAHPDEIPTLHAKAYRWYADKGACAEAIRHAVAAGHLEEAVKLMDGNTRVMWSNRVDRYLSGLNDEQLARHPRLCLWYAWALVFAGKSDEYLRPLELAEHAWENDSASLGLTLSIRATAAQFRRDTQAAIRLAKKALMTMPATEVFFRGLAAIQLAAAHIRAGNPRDASFVLQRVRDAATVSKRTSVLRLVDEMMGYTQIISGELRAAKESLEDCSRAEGGEVALKESPAWHLSMGAIHLEWNEMERAEQHLRTGIDVGEHTGRLNFFGALFTRLSRVLWATGRRDEAIEELERAIDTARRSGNEVELNDARAHLAAFQIEAGDIREAARWRDEADLSLDEEPTFPRESILVTYARLLAREGRHPDAVELLLRIEAAATAAGRYFSVVPVQVLRAAVHNDTGDKAESLRALAAAVAKGEPNRFTRAFLDAGAPIASLLRELAEGDPNQPQRYIQELVAAFDIVHTPPSRTRVVEVEDPPDWYRLDPLSERELEVLRCIKDGLSNADIAEELFISLNTVKTHTKKINLKLFAKSRTQAVALAERWGILV